jgi:uncharacterized protein
MQHAVNWFEIPVADLGRAMKFYETVSGKKLKREAFGAPGEEMAIFQVDDDQTGVSGCLMAGPNSKPAVQGTLVYLNAEPSIDAWLNRVEGAGGKIVQGKTALPPGMGYFAHVADTEGNRLGLHALA